MELKISKKFLCAIIGGIAVLSVGSIIVVRRSETVAAPYAGVRGEDLPAVVGESSLGGTTIPYSETANYKQYTPELFASARQSGKTILLYYYANWCASCWEQEPIHAEFFDQARKSDLLLIGFRINIDDKAPIMREYSINYSHSYVLLDQTGKVASKFFGTHSAKELANEVSKAL